MRPHASERPHNSREMEIGRVWRGGKTALDERIDEFLEKERAEETRTEGRRDTYMLVAREEYYRDGTGAGPRDTFYRSQVVEFNAFLAAFLGNRKARFWHECIFPHRPCRLYADIEFTGDEMRLGEARRIEVEENVRRRLLERNPDVPRAWTEPIVLDACRPDKYSVHLIYENVWFASGSDAGRFMQGVPYVDPHYPARDKTVWLRMPFSAKRAFANPLLPREPKPESLCTEDFEILMLGRCLVSTWCTQGYYARYFRPPPPPERMFAVADVAQSVVGEFHGGLQRPRTVPCEAECKAECEAECERTRSMVEHILDYVRISYSPDASRFRCMTLRIESGGAWSCVVSPGLFCPNIGRTHRSHDMYLSSLDSCTVTMTCPDVECRKMVVLPEDFSIIARLSTHPHQHSHKT